MADHPTSGTGSKMQRPMEDAHASYHRRRLTDEKDAPSYSQSGYLHSAFVSIGWLWEFSREICEPCGLWSEAFYSACTVVRVSSFLSYLTPGPLPCGSIPTGKVLPPGFRLMQTGSNRFHIANGETGKTNIHLHLHLRPPCGTGCGGSKRPRLQDKTGPHL